jgi:hypothetical protein
MKLIKTASGKKTIKLSKSEWELIGKKAGWIKKASNINFEELEEMARDLYPELDDMGLNNIVDGILKFAPSTTEEAISRLKAEKELRDKNKTFYVSTYETSRAYGGPEEGGWWYTNYELLDSEPVVGKENAHKMRDKLQAEADGMGENDEDLGSARGFDQYPDPSGGDPMYDHSDADIPRGFSGSARNIRVLVEDTKGEHETTETPYYE